MITDVSTLLWIGVGLLAALIVWKILKKIVLALIVGLLLIAVGLFLMMR